MMLCVCVCVCVCVRVCVCVSLPGVTVPAMKQLLECRGFTVENKQAENPVREGVIEGTLSINQQTLYNSLYMHTCTQSGGELPDVCCS